MMKKTILFALLAIPFLFTGCSPAEGPESGSGNLLLSFRLEAEGKTFHGEIDHSAGTVMFKGIVYGKSVTGTDVRLADGAAISPDPESFVGKWPQSQVFTVSKDGTSADYEVILPDWQDQPYNSKVTLGYLMLYDMDRLKIISWEDLTHVIPTFVYVNGDATIDSGFMDLKIGEVKALADAHGVKTIVSFGGPTTGKYTEATNTPEKRELLADAMWTYVKDHGLDGLDIDFEEYDSVKDETKLSNLLEFFRLLSEKKDPGMMMTSTIAGAWLSYGTQWHTYFDYVSIMSYDYNVNNGSPVQHSPYDLFLRDIEHAHEIDGMPLSKLCPGLPFYGNTWDPQFLSGDQNHRTIPFWEIVNHYKDDVPDITEISQIGSTLWNGKDLVRRKCRYIVENNLGGIMFWQLTHDADEYEDQLLPVIGEELGINEE